MKFSLCSSIRKRLFVEKDNRREKRHEVGDKVKYPLLPKKKRLDTLLFLRNKLKLDPMIKNKGVLVLR